MTTGSRTALYQLLHNIRTIAGAGHMQGSKAILKVEIRLIIFNALFCSQQKLLPHCVYKLGILYTSVVPSQEQHHFCHKQNVVKYSYAVEVLCKDGT